MSTNNSMDSLDFPVAEVCPSNLAPSRLHQADSCSPPPPTPEISTPVPSDATSACYEEIACSLLFVLAGIPLQGIGRNARILAKMLRPLTLASSMLMGLFDFSIVFYESGSLRVVYVCWSLSHLCRFVSLISLQRLHNQQLWGRTREELAASISCTLLTRPQEHRNPFDLKLTRPKAGQVWAVLGLAVVNTANSLCESFLTYHSDGFPPWVCSVFAWFIALGYAVSHIAFVCGQALLLAAVAGALYHVRESSRIFETQSVDWGEAIGAYMDLVRQLRSHCGFVRLPALMSFMTLVVTSVACGAVIWHIGARTQYGRLLTIVQCSNFVVWSGLLLILLNSLVSVNERIHATFTDKARRGLEGRDEPRELRFGMLSLLRLTHDLAPGGWFLIGSTPLTRSIFRLSTVPVVLNLVAKVYSLSQFRQA